MSLHDGHRERLRQRFRDEGLEHFTDVQALELLLFYAIARQDTNLIAHRLLNQFGSLPQVLNAPSEELCRVEGIGESTALYLRLLAQTWKRCEDACTAQPRALATVESCAQYLNAFFYGQKTEMVYLLCLDAKCRLLRCAKLGQGSVNSTDLSIRKIVETALSVNAASVVLAHNHPDGVAVPSHEDISATIHVAAALQAVDVNFIDHLIICDEDYVSLMQSGYLAAEGKK